MLNHTQKCGKIYGWWYVLCASWIVPASPKLLDFKDTNYVMCALFIELTTGWKRYDNSVTLPPSGLQYVFRQDKATNIVCLFFLFLFFYMYRLNAVFYLYFIVTYWNFFFLIVVCNSFRLCFHILSHPVSINKQFMSYSNCDMYRWWGQCGLLPVQRLNFSSGLTLITFSVSEVWILMDEVWVKFD